MPGIPLVARETSSYTRSAEPMCREDSRVRLSADEEIAAEESLSIYCKPVELYNILQRRAVKNPSFLQRCLLYQILEKCRRRVHMTISLPGTAHEGTLPQSPFPLYVILARLISDVTIAQHTAEYRFSRACILNNFTEVGGSTDIHATFTLPEINKLAWKSKSGSLSILLMTFAGTSNTVSDLTTGRLEMVSFSSNNGGHCLFGKIPIETLCTVWEKSPNLGLGQRVELAYPVEMYSRFVKLSGLNKDQRLSVLRPVNPGNTSTKQLVHVNILAEEIGAKEKSPYNTFTYSDVSSSSQSRIFRLRAGNVVFNYRYYNNKLQRSEVTEDFSCPFCLVKCGSFEGMRHHLLASHDLFSFEFWVTEEYQAVNVSVKPDNRRSEVVADCADPKQQTFFYCSKRRSYKRSKRMIQLSNNLHPLEANIRSGDSDLLDKANGGNGYHDASMTIVEYTHVPSSLNIHGISNAAAQSYTDPEFIQSSSGNNLAPPAVLQFAKTRKLSVERTDPRKTLLQKRQFFHSHRAQPMAIEQVMSDRDSEDEVDDDVADLEDRRMLDDFVDVTKDEKQMMHLWNSFVRKQRVLADGHIPWACEAFTKFHGRDLLQAPSLIWCWRLFLIKLWNHGLLDARTMNNCNIILEQIRMQDMGPMET